MSITYRELQRMLGRMTDEQLDMDISVYSEAPDEFYSVEGIGFIKDGEEASDVLDVGHPYLVIHG
jgi:hypothetical protein